jgi:hypothetical protein
MRREQQERKQLLFPVALVPHGETGAWKCFDDRGIASAREIREYFIPDFSNWKDHDHYRKTFDRLLKDLQATTKAAVPGTNGLST